MHVYELLIYIIYIYVIKFNIASNANAIFIPNMLLGSVYIFQLKSTAWSQQSKIVVSTSQPIDFCGSGVALSSTYLFIGCPGSDIGGAEYGAIYIYQFKSPSYAEWSLLSTLLSFDGAVRDSFGYSLTVEDNNMFVGAIGDDDSGTNSGNDI